MQTILMRTNERQQFELLKQLITRKNGLTAQEIMDSSKLSLHTIYRYEKQIADGLSHVFENQSVFLSKENGYYKVFIDDSLSVSYVIDKMGLYYLKISQQFSLSDALFYQSYASVEALAQDVNLSLSHTYKILKRMNKSFEPFNIRITFPDKSNRTNIVGDEKGFRITMFYIYWTIYKGIEWPFYHAPISFSEFESSIKTEQLSPSQKTRLIYYQTFTYWQIIYRKEYVSISKEFLDYLEIFEEVSPVSFPLPIKELLYKNHVSESVIHAEESYFGFLARFYIANIDSFEDKVLITNKLIASKLPLTTFASDLLNDFLKKYSIILTEENYVLNYYQIIFNLLYIQFFGIHVPFSQTLDEKFPYLKTYTDLFDIDKDELTQFVYEKLSSDLFPSISKSSTLVEYLAKLFYLVLNSSVNQQPLKVLIQYSKTIYGYDLIKNNLSHTFGEDVLEFTFDILEADIIISDSFEEISDTINNPPSVFYFEYPYDTTSWQDLIVFISKRLYSKFL